MTVQPHRIANWLLACTAIAAPFAGTQAQPKPAEAATARANAAVVAALPFSDRQAFDDARRGFVAALPDALVPGAGDRAAWSMKPYAFLANDKAPDTVNPSLWRQAQLNAIHGLFKVTDGIYQVRGMDLSNMTIVEGARPDRHRSAAHRRDREGGARAVSGAPAEEAGGGGDLHPQPCRSLRRRQGRDQRRRGAGRQGHRLSRRNGFMATRWPRT